MDTTQLEKRLKKFQKGCADKGKPISRLWLEEAYLGDVSTSYIVKVTAPWMDEVCLSEALEFLIDVLFETTSQETRKKVFSVYVVESKDALCSSLNVA